MKHRRAPLENEGVSLSTVPFGVQADATESSVALRRATVKKLSDTLTPATWLWSEGKMSGVPEAILTSLTTPITDMTKTRAVTSTSTRGHHATPRTRLRKNDRTKSRLFEPWLIVLRWSLSAGSG
eukprot:CAMPEP_0194500066 /NCGR_PEP_ID=MMETSP0253-20130528/16160_1 /TAXON_ID=2966 /ORGANISM="Noctiluca scintillans" /LENGTH=124 /DNA_ID=CAMNT_0039341877 /DNA_START=11 /DNA_END=382 /DNA_ORIENTATION=+